MTYETLSRTDWIRLGIRSGILPDTIEVEAAPAVGGGTMTFDTVIHVGPIFEYALKKGVYKSLYDALQSNKKLASRLGSAAAAQEHFRKQFARGSWVARGGGGGGAYSDAARRKFIAELVARMARADMKRYGASMKDPNAFVEAQRAILNDVARMRKVDAAWESYRAAAEAADEDADEAEAE